MSLPIHKLGPTVHRMVDAPERVRLRIREEMTALGVSQRELAERLHQVTGIVWSQSGVGKVLTGRVELTVADVDAMVRALGMSLIEAMRDRGLEFVADMTPTELRLLSLYRQKAQPFKDAIQILHGMTPVTTVSKLDTPVTKRPKRGRPQNSDLAKKQAK